MHRIAQSYSRRGNEASDTIRGSRLADGRQTMHYLRNAGRRWSQGEVATLRALARQNTPARVIGLRLGRSERAVHSKAFEEKIALQPVSQPLDGESGD